MRRILLVLALCTLAAAEDWAPPENKNAALAYWRAISLMQEPTGEAASVDLQPFLTGEKAWDQDLLGAYLESNGTALRELERGSRLPECNFGLDYEDGAAMLLVHLASARKIAKLNVLHARQHLAQGRPSEAIEAFLVGFRFADHVWRDGTLITALVARAISKLTIRPLFLAIEQGGLDAEALAPVDRAMRETPPYWYDWSIVISSEKACFAVAWKRIIESDDPKREMEAGGMFQDEFGSLADLVAGKAPKEAEDRFRKEWGLEPKDLGDAEKMREYFRKSQEEYGRIIDEVAAALRGTYLESRPRLEAIEAKMSEMGYPTRMMMPALSRADGIRAEAEAERGGLLALIAIARHRASKGGDPESLDGLDVPTDPFTGKAFELAITKRGLEVRSGGKDGDGNPIAFRMGQ